MTLPPEDIEISSYIARAYRALARLEFADGAVIAQLGCRLPDMRLPIQLAPDLAGAAVPCQSADACRSQRSRKLTFFAPDYEAFPGA